MDAKFCPKCGHDQAQPGNARSTPAVQQNNQPAPASPTCCPLCRSADAVRAVPAIVREGSWTSTSVGGAYGTAHTANGQYAGSFNGTTVTQNSGATGLARLFVAPATEWEGWSPWFGIGIFAALIGFCIGAMTQVSGQANWTTLFVLAFSILGVGIIIGVIDTPRQNQVNASKRDLYQRRMAVWNRAIYCARCDAVTDPLTNTSVRADQFQSLFPHRYE